MPMAKHTAEIPRPSRELTPLAITQNKSRSVLFHTTDFVLLQVLRDDLLCWDMFLTRLSPQIFRAALRIKW